MAKQWECFWERLIRRSPEWVLVHDGQRNPGQFEFPPEEVRFYTRVYRWLIDGEPVNTWAKFVYDLREGEATVHLTYHEPGFKGEQTKETMVLDIPDVKEALSDRQAG